MLVLIVCCGTRNQEKKEFYEFLDQYIKKNPYTMLYEVDSLGKKSKFSGAYPTYHVFFNKNVNNDSQILIKLHPFYTSFNKEVKNDSLIYKKADAKGFFIYKKKYPIIVFDEDNIMDKFFSGKLNSSIPDTLKHYGDEIIHLESPMEILVVDE